MRYLEMMTALKSKKAIMIIIAVITIVILGTIEWHFYVGSHKKAIDYPFYVDRSFFSEKELKLIDYSSSEKEMEIARQVVEVAQKIANGESQDNSNILFQKYAPNAHFDNCDKVDLNIKIISCKIENNLGFLWVVYTCTRYDGKGNKINGSENILSLWYIKNVDGIWSVDRIREPA